jgi:HEAT repeat protein
MKALAVLFFALIAVQAVQAQSAEFTVEKKSAIVDNLTVGIKSENTGLHTSSSFVLSDLVNDGYLNAEDASKALIPLLKLLKNGETEEVRIAAALALYQLGDEIGIYQLRGVGKFDDDEKVAVVCRNLYYTYHKLNGTEYLVSF